MPIQNRTTYQATVASLASDNSTGDVSPSDLRTMENNLSDSVKHINNNLVNLSANATSWDVDGYDGLYATCDYNSSQTLNIETTLALGTYVLLITKSTASDVVLTITADGTSTTKYKNGSANLTLVGASGSVFMIKVDRQNTTIYVYDALNDASSAGDVTKVGTPVDNQIGVWTGDGLIEGDDNLTFTGNVLGVGGGDAGTSNIIVFQPNLVQPACLITNGGGIGAAIELWQLTAKKILLTSLNTESWIDTDQGFGIGTNSPTSFLNATLHLGGVGSLVIPSGTTAQRPTTPLNGMVRYNQTLFRYEGYNTNSSSWVSLSGSTATAKSANYTAVDGDFILMTTSTINRTVTLPLAANSTNAIIEVKKIDSAIGNVIIDANGAETIDGATTFTIDTQYQSIKLHCDGTSWWIK